MAKNHYQRLLEDVRTSEVSSGDLFQTFFDLDRNSYFAILANTEPKATMTIRTLLDITRRKLEQRMHTVTVGLETIDSLGLTTGDKKEIVEQEQIKLMDYAMALETIEKQAITAAITAIKRGRKKSLKAVLGTHEDGVTPVDLFDIIIDLTDEIDQEIGNKS